MKELNDLYTKAITEKINYKFQESANTFQEMIDKFAGKVDEGSNEAVTLKMAGDQIQEMVMSGQATQPPSNGGGPVDQNQAVETGETIGAETTPNVLVVSEADIPPLDVLRGSPAFAAADIGIGKEVTGEIVVPSDLQTTGQVAVVGPDLPSMDVPIDREGMEALIPGDAEMPEVPYRPQVPAELSESKDKGATTPGGKRKTKKKAAPPLPDLDTKVTKTAAEQEVQTSFETRVERVLAIPGIEAKIIEINKVARKADISDIMEMTGLDEEAVRIIVHYRSREMIAKFMATKVPQEAIETPQNPEAMPTGEPKSTEVKATQVSESTEKIEGDIDCYLLPEVHPIPIDELRHNLKKGGGYKFPKGVPSVHWKHDDIEALGDDIKERGLKDPLVITQDGKMVICGMNRLLIADGLQKGGDARFNTIDCQYVHPEVEKSPLLLTALAVTSNLSQKGLEKDPESKGRLYLALTYAWHLIYEGLIRKEILKEEKRINLIKQAKSMRIDQNKPVDEIRRILKIGRRTVWKYLSIPDSELVNKPETVNTETKKVKSGGKKTKSNADKLKIMYYYAVFGKPAGHPLYSLPWFGVKLAPGEVERTTKLAMDGKGEEKYLNTRNDPEFNDYPKKGMAYVVKDWLRLENVTVDEKKKATAGSNRLAAIRPADVKDMNHTRETILPVIKWFQENYASGNWETVVIDVKPKKPAKS